MADGPFSVCELHDGAVAAYRIEPARRASPLVIDPSGLSKFLADRGLSLERDLGAVVIASVGRIVLCGGALVY
jgi:hypothetical protein